MIETTSKPKTVYALVMTFEENGIRQRVSLWARKREPDSFRRNFEQAINRKDSGARLIALTLEKFKIAPAEGVAGLPTAYAVALTYQGDDGTEQSVELFNRRKDAEAARASHERAFNDGSGQGPIALTLHDDLLITPAIEADGDY
jgi:hypothetical protein